MDDEVRIANTQEEMRKMTRIYSKFAEWTAMRFGGHKCVYFGRKFIQSKREDVVLEDFNLCGEAIPQLEGYEAFKYFGKYKGYIVGEEIAKALAITQPK